MEYKYRDCDYFNGFDKGEIILMLAELERDGNLVEFIQKVAPDFVHNGQVDVFLLCGHLELF